MTRNQLIEQILREVYGGQPTDDADITPQLVNLYINQGIGMAVKQNYKEAIQLDGVGYVNNSFYTTFKGISVSQDETFLWKVILPQVPLGVGRNEGVANFKFKSTDGKVTLDGIPLSINQKAYALQMRTIPNKFLYYTEGINAFAVTPLLLNTLTASVTIISGGDSTDLTSTLNVPDDYIPTVMSFAVQMLISERKQPKDLSNDGADVA